MARSTAEGACALRAAGTTLRDPEIRNPDYMAKDFIAPGLKLTALAKVPLLRRLSPRILESILPGALWFELARTRHMDDVLLREVADGATRSCFLGAGLDSRCYRLRDELARRALFEVDHPVTAAVKAERLNAIFGEMPDHVNYVHVDFNTQSVGERLAAHGFDPAARSIVLWSGVAPYLEPEGVAQTLRWFASGTSPGSAMCFDYLWQEMLDGDDSFHGAPEAAKAGRGGRRAVQVRDPARRHAGVRRRLRPHLGRGPGPRGRARADPPPRRRALRLRRHGARQEPTAADRGGRSSIPRAPSRRQRRRQEPREDERAPRRARGDGPRRRRDLHQQRQLPLPGAAAAARGAGEAARGAAQQERSAWS